jgi:hypothetical protein
MKTRWLWWIAKIDPPLKPGQTWRSIKNWRDGSYSDDGEYLGKWSHLTDQELGDIIKAMQREQRKRNKITK